MCRRLTPTCTDISWYSLIILRTVKVNQIGIEASLSTDIDVLIISTKSIYNVFMTIPSVIKQWVRNSQSYENKQT